MVVPYTSLNNNLIIIKCNTEIKLKTLKKINNILDNINTQTHTDTQASIYRHKNAHVISINTYTNFRIYNIHKKNHICYNISRTSSLFQFPFIYFNLTPKFDGEFHIIVSTIVVTKLKYKFLYIFFKISILNYTNKYKI